MPQTVQEPVWEAFIIPEVLFRPSMEQQSPNYMFVESLTWYLTSINRGRWQCAGQAYYQPRWEFSILETKKLPSKWIKETSQRSHFWWSLIIKSRLRSQLNYSKKLLRTLLFTLQNWNRVVCKERGVLAPLEIHTIWKPDIWPRSSSEICPNSHCTLIAVINNLVYHLCFWLHWDRGSFVHVALTSQWKRNHMIFC